MKYRVIERFRGKYPIQEMCNVFGVSRSGYYAWRKRQDKPNRDSWLVELIAACQKQTHQTYGCRRVRRWIRKRFGKNVNLKAIIRVMRKYDLLAQIRRKRPYMNYKASVYKYPNLRRDLSRGFSAKEYEIKKGEE